MALERFFVFVYPEDRRLRELLDLAVFVINPDEKWPAHITLAGPYKSKSVTPRKTNLSSRISTLGVGEFRSPSQQTIYLKVGGPGIESYWDKPDYPGSRIFPHLTLYDGQDTEFATHLKQRLDELRLFFFFHVTQVHIVTSIKGQMSRTLESVVNFHALAQTASLDVDHVKALLPDERIEYATEILKKAKYYLSLAG